MSEREYQRTKLQGEVIILNGVPPEKAKAVNISLGGMYFRAHHPRPIGEELELFFTLPPDRRIKVICKITRVTNNKEEELPAGIAVIFLNLEQEEQIEIEQYVRKMARILKALFFELNRPQINKNKVRELVDQSPIHYQHPMDILREKVTAELANLKLRPGHKFRK